MHRHSIAMLLCLTLLAGCVGGGGVDIFTNPISFLERYPLGETKEQVYDRMGTPDDRATFDDRETWSYLLGRGWGKRRFSFVFENGKVFDVRFHDQGPYNGSSARQLQGLATASR